MPRAKRLSTIDSKSAFKARELWKLPDGFINPQVRLRIPTERREILASQSPTMRGQDWLGGNLLRQHSAVLIDVLRALSDGATVTIVEEDISTVKVGEKCFFSDNPLGAILQAIAFYTPQVLPALPEDESQII